jgi:transcriptional regulator with XRE-family HTH domain
VPKPTTRVRQKGNPDILLGRVIKELRMHLSLSQEELGFESGYSRTYVGELERGEKTPSFKTVLDLANALKIPASEMVRRVEKLLDC